MALPYSVHSADIGPIEYSWIGENSSPGHETLVTFSFAATYFDMDATNGLAAGIFPNTDGGFLGQAENGFSFETWGISGGIEAWIPTSASHYFVGALEGAWVDQDQNFEGTNNDQFAVLPINGEGNPAVIGAPLTFGTSSSGEFLRVAGLTGIATDVTVGTKAGVGAYVAYSELNLDVLRTISIFTGEFGSLDETVKTWSAGLAVFGESRRNLMPGVGVFFKGRAAALYANGELNGFTAPLSANDRQEKFAGLIDGPVGFDFAIGANATVSVFGGAAWRDDVFEIVNPITGTSNTTTGPFPPAHLEQTDLIEYSAGGKVQLTF